MAARQYDCWRARHKRPFRTLPAYPSRGPLASARAGESTAGADPWVLPHGPTTVKKRPMAHQLHQRYPAAVATPALARRHIADVLRERAQPELIPTATLLVSELVTNAVIHAGGSIELRRGQPSCRSCRRQPRSTPLPRARGRWPRAPHRRGPRRRVGSPHDRRPRKDDLVRPRARLNPRRRPCSCAASAAGKWFGVPAA